MNREILKLAIPNILSNISVPLMSTTDTVLMGHLSGLHLGAVGISAMIFNFLFWNFGFLRMSTTGLTAQAFGREEGKSIASGFYRALFTSLFIGILLLVLWNPVWQLSAGLLDISESHYPIARNYFIIRMLSGPAALSLMVVLGFYFGMQNAIIPLIITILINVVNILLSIVMVVWLKMEETGVALGTTIAQYAGLLFGLILIFIKYPFLKKSLIKKDVFNLYEMKRFFHLNKDIFIRTLCLTTVFAFFYRQSSSAGELILATSVILLQFLNWMSYGVDGFAHAAESLTGKYYGRGDSINLKKSIKYSFIWGGFLAIVYALFYWAGGKHLAGLFTSDQGAINLTMGYYFWVILLPLAGFASYIWDGIYVGLTLSKAMRNSMVLSFITFLVVYFASRSLPGIHALWLALLVFLLMRGIFQAWLFSGFIKNLLPSKPEGESQ